MPSTRQPKGDARRLPARFLVVEGLDGAGTSTQAKLVARALRGRDLHVCLTAEPTEGPLGQVARAHIRGDLELDPYTAALVFSGDRADHLAREIRPALSRGEWVVCDRYLLSTLAYQGAEGVDRGAILAASSPFEAPDLTVFLDVPDAERLQRIAPRGRTDRYEDAGLASQLRSSYEESIALLRRNGHRIDVVDGSPAVDEVLHSILTRLDALS